MIQSLSHVTIYVLDQEAARAFYVDKLGFELRADMTMGNFRWLTVGPKAAPGLQMILMPVVPSAMMDAETAADLRKLVEKGAFGCGVLETDDCQASFEELSGKGVVFKSPPAQRPYGLEAVLRDNSGNWFSPVERPG